MSFILNIDTSLEKASVSIAENGSNLEVLTNDVQKDHASFLHVAVQTLTNQLKLSLKNADAIAVTIGPGSYTGIRVGLSAAKGLCYALSKPLIALSSLEALAKQAIISNTHPAAFYFCPMIDARRMEVFTATYRADMQQINPPAAMVVCENSFEELLQNKGAVFFGSGMEKWEKICSNANALFSDVTDLSAALSLLSFQKFTQKKFADTALSGPLYVKEFFDGR